MSSDGSIMLFNIFTTLFPGTTMDQLAAMKDATKLNCTTIAQLVRCSVEIENNDKYKKCIFFVVPGSGEELLGMSDIELLNFLNISCNKIGTDKEEKA